MHGFGSVWGSRYESLERVKVVVGKLEIKCRCSQNEY